MMKKIANKYFYRIDNKKQPIPASNVRRKSKPPGHQWKELPNFCCETIDVDCTCGDRFFVQVDRNGKPVDGTLLKRTYSQGKPIPEEGIRYAEVQWKSPCCLPPPPPPTYSLTFSFTKNDGESGSFLLKQGEGVLSSTTGNVGPITYNNLEAGLPFSVTVTNSGSGQVVLNITGGEVYSYTGVGMVTHLFNLTGDTVIEAFLQAGEGE